MSERSCRFDRRKTAERGYGYRWQKERAAYLLLHPFCVMCLAEAGIVALDVAAIILECADKGIALPIANVVDHKVKHEGDDVLFWDHENWQSLCKPHHDSDKQMAEKSGRARVKFDAKGRAIW